YFPKGMVIFETGRLHPPPAPSRTHKRYTHVHEHTHTHTHTNTYKQIHTCIHLLSYYVDEAREDGSVKRVCVCVCVCVWGGVCVCVCATLLHMFSTVFSALRSRA